MALGWNAGGMNHSPDEQPRRHLSLAGGDGPPYDPNPDATLQHTADAIRSSLDCEAVCILLWYEGRQKLVTRYVSGLPTGLKGPEVYGPEEGLTGNYIFSQGKRLRCRIDFKSRTVKDAGSGETISDQTIKWQNMRAFKRRSQYKDFRSLMGAPVYAEREERSGRKRQKLGVVKLVNKIEDDGGKKRLDECGFSQQDEEALAAFLPAVENAIQGRRIAQYLESLGSINGKLTGTSFKYVNVLKEVVRSCADVLNYRVCLVRRQQGGRLQFEASNLGAIDNDNYVPACDPSALAMREKVPVVWEGTPGGGGQALRLQSLDGHKTFHLASPSERFLGMIADYGTRSFLIVPILLRGLAIGTLECYTSQPHEFFEREAGAVGNYADSLAAALVYDKQQKLLKHLIEVQSTRGESGRQGNEETQLITETLEYIKEVLGGEPTVVALLCAERLANTMLECDTLHGVTTAELRRVLRPREFDAVSNGGATASLLNRPASYTIKDDEGRVHNIYRAPFGLTKGAPPLGSLIVDAHDAGTAKAFSKQVLSAEVKRLGMGLGTIERFRKSEALLEIVDEASRLEDLEEIHDFILKKTVSYFGFDYGVISRVNSVSRRVVTERGTSVNPDVPSPEDWKHLSDYSLDHDKDILVYVVNNKEAVSIYGPTALEDWGPWLNKKIFRKYKHSDLIRVIIPFIFHQSVKSGDEFDHVLGVIEAGFHINRQKNIPDPLRKAFQFFINSCAKSLQRVTLLEQKNSEEDVIKKLDQEKDPNAILRTLLEESVKLVGGDSGDITFLTHRDGKLRLLDDPIVYNIPKRRLNRLVKEQEVRAEGGSISAKVAAEKKYYWTNDVEADPLYRKEFEDVKSELCVPLLYSGEAVGVLNINANHRNRFDERKAELIQSIVNRAMGLYQKARVNNPLSTLVSPFNVFANSDNIYSTVIKLVEDFLGTETVSIWEKRPVRDDFELEWVGASPALATAYREAGIRKLSSDTFTGDVVRGEIVEVDSEKLRSSRFVFPHFAQENGLEFMTAVPISLGGEVYAVIDVFSRRPVPLFAEEKFFLRLLASKAAIALQSAKLIYSFNEISAAMPEGKIDSVLQLITDSALEVLHANPVILYRYDAEQERFVPKPIISGWLHNESYRDKEAPVMENDLANKIRLSGTRYFKDKKEYGRFEKEVKRRWQGTFSKPFWDREDIKSLAALRLKHGDDVVGVMFVNYRARQSFEEHKRLIEAFASQATSAIVNAKLLEQNKLFWELRRSDSLALALSHVIPGLAHNSGNLLESLTLGHLNFTSNVEEEAGDTVSKELCRRFIRDQQRVLRSLRADFNRLKDYRKLDEFKKERCNLKEPIDGALRILSKKLEGVNVVWPARRLPQILCDKSQIQHMLLNLFLNSITAMAHKRHKELRIDTSFDARRGRVRIDITDNGCGIPPEQRDRIFEPSFSTRKSEGGSGYGLSTSRYIVRNHGGSIEFLQPKSNEGATFSILLPV